VTDAPPKLTPTQVGGAVFTALAVPWAGAWIGSHTGTTGTVTGTAIGSVLPVVAGWLFLRATYHARQLPWRRVKPAKPWQYAVAVPAVAVGVFAVSMAGLSGVEAKVLHKSLAASVGHAKASGTTVGSLVGGAPVRPSPSIPEPSETPSSFVSPAPGETVPTIPATPTATAPATAAPTSTVTPALPAVPATRPAAASPSVSVPAVTAPSATTEPRGAVTP